MSISSLKQLMADINAAEARMKQNHHWLIDSYNQETEVIRQRMQQNQNASEPMALTSSKTPQRSESEFFEQFQKDPEAVLNEVAATFAKQLKTTTPFWE